MPIYNAKRNQWIDHRDTSEYRRRKQMLRDYWLIGLIPTLALPPGIQLATLFFGVFISLSYLDETPYQLD
jgi:hypothetical protein